MRMSVFFSIEIRGNRPYSRWPLSLDFKLSCMCYARGANIAKKANWGISARRNIKITLLKELFIIKITLFKEYFIISHIDSL